MRSPDQVSLKLERAVMSWKWYGTSIGTKMLSYWRHVRHWLHRNLPTSGAASVGQNYDNYFSVNAEGLPRWLLRLLSDEMASDVYRTWLKFCWWVLLLIKAKVMTIFWFTTFRSGIGFWCDDKPGHIKKIKNREHRRYICKSKVHKLIHSYDMTTWITICAYLLSWCYLVDFAVHQLYEFKRTQHALNT